MNSELRTKKIVNVRFPGKQLGVWKIEVCHLMLHDKPSVISELAPKRTKFVKILEIMV